MTKKTLFLSVIVVGITLFYWLQLRPVQIRHDCSWKKVIEPAKPAYPALTEEELKTKGMIVACPTPLPFSATVWDLQQAKASICRENNEKIINEYSVAREAIPEKENWRQATKEEYQFCLHDKGL